MSASHLAFIGSLGGQELIWIFIIVLLLFGAKKLPELARGVGKSMGEFKKAREEFEHEITRTEEETIRDAKAKEERLKAEARVKAAADKESHEA